jgi:hypothetical protein
MKFWRKTGFVVLVAIISTSVLASANAQTCVPPSGFVDKPHPTAAAAEQLIAHTEEITVDRPLAEVISVNSRTDIKDAIHKTGSLPGVTGTYPLGKITFGMPGSRRLVCLTDGSTLQEQVLELEQSKSFYRFRYIVWNYTSSVARPIEYGVGEFRDSEISGGRTHIVWTYAFKLKDQEFPGYLGAFGRYLFRVGFLDRQYAAMMRATLQGNQAPAKDRPSGTNK